jgi:hypothetical protein
MKQIKTYARYTFKNDITAKIVGNGWIEVEREMVKYFPSGRHTVVVIKGVAIKARYCEIVQVVY